MPSNLDEKAPKIELLKNIVEIAAVIIGGIWAWVTFGIKDAPALHKLSVITPELKVDKVNNKMHLSYFVTIKNSGKSDFSVIEPVAIKVWLIPAKKLTEQKYFDWEQYMKGASDLSINDEIYKGDYSPDESIKISHDFFLDEGDNDSAKYTVLIRASTKFSYKDCIFCCEKTDTDYAYDVKIGYAKSDTM